MKKGPIIILILTAALVITSLIISNKNQKYLLDEKVSYVSESLEEMIEFEETLQETITLAETTFKESIINLNNVSFSNASVDNETNQMIMKNKLSLIEDYVVLQSELEFLKETHEALKTYIDEVKEAFEKYSDSYEDLDDNTDDPISNYNGLKEEYDLAFNGFDYRVDAFGKSVNLLVSLYQTLVSYK